MQFGWYDFGVSAQGKSGGLALFWRKDLSNSLNCCASSFIDATVHWNGVSWRLTGFYGHPEATKRKFSWDTLRKLSTVSQLPWVCFGDYNEILNQKEFRGTGSRPQW